MASSLTDSSFQCGEKGDVNLKKTAPIHGNHSQSWASPAAKLANEEWAYQIKDTPYVLAFYSPLEDEDHDDDYGHYALRRGNEVLLESQSYLHENERKKPTFALQGGIQDSSTYTESFFIYLSPNNDGLVIVEYGQAAATHEIGPQFFSWKDGKHKLVVCDDFSYNHRSSSADKNATGKVYYEFIGWGGSEPIILAAAE